MERQLEKLVQSISTGSGSVALVGEPGVGKSALVDGLAFHIANGTRPLIPPSIDDTAIVMVASRDIVAGTGVQGDLEGRLNDMLSYLRTHPNVVLFFDEMHTLLDTGNQASRAIATALKPPMATPGQFRCIGATTDQEYARFIAGDQAMNSRFTRILIPEPSVEDSIAILSGTIQDMIPDVSRSNGVSIGEDAVRASVEITHRYSKSERLPRKAKQHLQHVISQKTYDILVGRSSESHVTAHDVAKAYGDIHDIPIDALDDQRDSFFDGLNKRLRDRVKGQEEAVASVVSWLRVQSSGWLDPQRPRGRFLFLGPPGVGKTELARTLAEEIMHDRGALVVKNMAEFKGEDARNQFMGASAGYVGFGETVTVYSRVMMRAYSVVILDEIEKAHPSLSDPLLSVLDGAAEDAQGRFVDFSQCIFVLTSNAIQVSMGDDDTVARRALLGMEGIWTPAFVDRLDRVIVFRPLNRATQLEILQGMIERLERRARRPLPVVLKELDTMNSILDAVQTDESNGSARRLERCLMDWLMANNS